MTLKFLVIGYGAIGRRHARNILALGHRVALLRHGGASPNTDSLPEYYRLEDVFENEKHVDAAVVCTPTANHFADVQLLIENRIPFLLEKPPAADLASTLEMAETIRQADFERYDIAFNMRYYPCLKFIDDYLSNLGNIYSARVCCGYHLPDWRPGVDYRTTSSASKELGGGVHIELVHEIDYITSFLGMPEKVFGHVTKVSELEIETEDLCSAVLIYAGGATVELHLDYLSRKYLRSLQLIGQNATLEWDMNNGRVTGVPDPNSAAELLYSLDPSYSFNETYLQQLNHFIEVAAGRDEPKVDISSAVNTMAVLEAIKVSSATGELIDMGDIPLNQNVLS